MKFSCPACNQHIEAPEEMNGQTIVCPDCGLNFTALKSKYQKPSETSEKSFSTTAKVRSPVQEQLTESAQISKRAASFSKGAGFALFVSAICFIIAIYVLAFSDSGAQENAILFAVISGSALMVAFMLYLLAQLLHIRAALKK